MNAEYRFRYDETYVAECLKSYRRSHPTRMIRWVLKSFGFFGLGLLLVIGVMAKSLPMTGLFLSFIVLLAVSPAFDVWWARSRLRKSPFYNANVVVRFSADGYVGQEPNSRTELSWAAFTDGYRLSDGFLLFTGPQHFHWFSDGALVDGTVVELERLLEQKLSKFRRAEQTAAADRRENAAPAER